MHTYSTICIGESIHSFSFVLISSSAVLFAQCPFINVIRWKTLHCIYCFLPVRSSPLPVTVLFEFVRCETIPWLPLCCCCSCRCCCWCRQAETFGDRESCQQLPQKRQAGSKETNRKTCNWPDLLRERREDEQELREGARGRG